jgi:MoaA/NifB/PqqE/SkfB family radical SAM enzyme
MALLPMALPAAAREAPLYLRTSAPVSFGAGFYEAERHDLDVFHWMREQGQLSFAPDPEPRYLEIWVCSLFHDLSQELEIACGDARERTPLVWGWAPITVAVPAGAGHVELAANKLFPAAYHPADPRTLAVRIRPPHLHRDAVRHAHIARQHANGVLNTREMIEGRASLESMPRSLGIDMHGACNVKPPCVYCEWDFNKDLEGDKVDAPFTVETLREWGPFFDSAEHLVNCSIGEPFMMKNLDELFDAFGNAGKALEMATNGQILTDRNIQRMLGRNIELYISLDAGTPETYAKLRNTKFDAILANMRRLIEAKGGPGAFPRVYLVFMPMRVNVHELDDFIRICADLRVDRLVLRPLNYSDGIALDWERAGHRFEYQRELLPFDELVRVSGRAAELCRRLGVELSDQMDFGGAMGDQFDRLFEEGRRSVEADYPAVAAAAPAPAPTPVIQPNAAPEAHQGSEVNQRPEVNQTKEEVLAPVAVPAESLPESLPSLGSERNPACTEPWKSLYILRRGTFPCCYGGEPMTPMEGYREAWNSELIQGIRAELAAGRFHSYCLCSPACPMVRKSEHGDTLPKGQAAYVRVRRAWTRLDRLTGGRAGRLLHHARLAGVRARRAVTERGYAVRETRRLISGERGRRATSSSESRRR